MTYPEPALALVTFGVMEMVLLFGILGYGLIGARVAAYAKALEMDVIGWSRSLTPGDTVEAGTRIVDRDTLFLTADVLSVHLVLSDETRGRVGARELALMKDGALLVNTARAGLIDRAALLFELRRGRIRAPAPAQA